MNDERPTARSLEALTDRIESQPRLDPLVGALAQVSRRVNTGSRASVLRGDWLGHALHPLLTDVPIGCWTSSFVLDLVGGKRARPASQMLLGLGLLSVPPTVAAGLVDWDDIPDRPRRRAGAVHAVFNLLASVLYFSSWRHRRRGRHTTGVLLGFAGSGLATVGGFLGGHLAFARSAGVGERGELSDGRLSEDQHALDGKIGA